MLTTSFTTCIAFIATAMSPLMPLSAFGLFAATAVLMNYVLAITVFPCLLIIWENTGRLCCCCCVHCDHSTQKHSVISPQAVATSNGDIPPVVADRPPDQASESEEADEEPLRCLERCFVHHYTPLIRSRWRLLPLVCFTAYFVISAYWAFQVMRAHKM